MDEYNIKYEINYVPKTYMDNTFKKFLKIYHYFLKIDINELAKLYNIHTNSVRNTKNIPLTEKDYIRANINPKTGYPFKPVYGIFKASTGFDFYEKEIREGRLRRRPLLF